MVRIKNIVADDEVVFADYYPENTNDRGFIAMDIKTQKVIDSQLAESDGGAYLFHAAQRLRDCIKNNQYPETAEAMWY